MTENDNLRVITSRPHGILKGEPYRKMSARAVELMREGWDGPEIADLLSNEGHRRRDGTPLDPQYLYQVFYQAAMQQGIPMRPGFVIVPGKAPSWIPRASGDTARPPRRSPRKMGGGVSHFKLFAQGAGFGIAFFAVVLLLAKLLR